MVKSERGLMLGFVCFCFLLKVCLGAGKDQVIENKEVSSNRSSKNLFPFVWVTFQNDVCGSNNDGVCVQRGKCARRGGTASGSCKDGFGECCTFNARCNDTIPTVNVDQLVTILETPVPSTTQCTFRFRKEPNICQIHLNFVDVSMASADPEGFCSMDRLRITGSITIDDDFTTCGTLTSQHMYLTYGSQDTIEVTPLLKATASRYKIVATRIPCDSKNRAPDYCLQHFTTSTGTVKSFDFDKQQQNNQQYTICVRPLTQSQEVRWMPCSNTANAFDIVTNYGNAGACTTDWIQVLGKDKSCFGFPNTTSTWKPWNILVNFDGEEFPPPLPVFNLPADPNNCPATCPPAPTGLSGSVLCQCIGAAPPQSCQCTIDATSALGQAVAPQQPDFNNKGFCLEYTQG